MGYRSDSIVISRDMGPLSTSFTENVLGGIGRVVFAQKGQN